MAVMDAPGATARRPSVTKAAANATWIELPTIGARTGLIATLVVAASLLAGWSVISPPRGRETVGTRRCISAPRATCWRARG